MIMAMVVVMMMKMITTVCVTGVCADAEDGPCIVSVMLDGEESMIEFTEGPTVSVHFLSEQREHSPFLEISS